MNAPAKQRITEAAAPERSDASQRDAELKFESFVESIDGIVWELALPEWKFTFVSKPAERILGYPPEQWLEDPNFWRDHLHPDDRTSALDFCMAATEKGQDHQFEYRMIASDGQIVWLRDIVTVEMREGQPSRLRGVMIDVTERKREEAFHDGHRRVLEIIAADAPLQEALKGIVEFIEPQSNGMLCSILLLDSDGVHVRHGAAPNLPEDYIKAINGAPIGPKAGSCGTAMYRGERVIVTDTFEDPLWEDYRALAGIFGLRACWSTPILNHAGNVLGTFAMYYHEPRSPRTDELRLTAAATHLAGIAIERHLADEALRQSEERYRELAGRLISAQEEERRRISRELHDDIVQKVASLAIRISLVKQRAGASMGPFAGEITSLQGRVADLAEDIRQLSHQLHPAVLEHAGLIAALQSFVAEFNRIEEVEVKLTVPKDKEVVPKDIALCAYRVVQESLRNVAKHSGAKAAEVVLAIIDNDLHLSIRDEGQGFDVDTARGRGLGMVSIEERVRLCEGTVKITSELNRGTTLTARIPLSGS